MPYTLVVAEKPSVGRDLARVLGCRERGEGCFRGAEHVVTWAIGHVVALSDPDEINPEWKRWRMESLPMLPETIPLKVLPKTKTQFGCVKKLMRAKDCERVICATDAGREGELIFRYLASMAGCKKPVDRLWISSMTDDAIREGFASMKPQSAYDTLYESARCRSEADWLVGMNASRAFSLKYGALLPVGRVQTPTLALLVRRHHEIEQFKPEPYWTLTADFGDYTGLWMDEATREKKLKSEDAANEIAKIIRKKPAMVESVERTPKREAPPQLFDLTSLQRDANRLHGFTANKTLSLAQKLYEEHKLLTYPRTDSRYLPRGMVGKARAAISALPEPYAQFARALPEKLPLSRRVFDDQKVSDHHAIIPTGKKPDLEKLPPDERKLFDMVAKRLIAAFYPEFAYDALRVLTRAEGEAFESLGREVKQAGWKAVYGAEQGKEKEEEKRLPALSVGDMRTVEKAAVKAETTKPPAPHTDASLLAAMEHAGREIADEALRESMKKSGLGTPATRAAIIERLIAVGYAQRRGRAVFATQKGVRLIAVVPQDIASPETTGRWERALSDIVDGGMQPERFLEGIRRLSAALVEAAKGARADIAFEKEPSKGARKKGGRSAVGAVDATCPVCGKGKVLENSKAFYCEHWRAGCGLKIWKDGLVKAGGPVMTAARISRLLREGKLAGSTGTVTHEKGNLRFERINPKP